MGIKIKRSDGKIIELSISNSLDQGILEKGELYIGATHYLDPSARKIVHYGHSKFLVANLLGQFTAESPDVLEDIAILTKRPRDWIYFFFSRK